VSKYAIELLSGATAA